MNLEIESVKSVHCVGIGGVGVSAIARFFKHRGVSVSGSDASESPIVDGLRDDGVDVTVGHAQDNVSKEVDLVVYSIAVPHENPELRKARNLDIPTMTYPEALGLVSEDMFTVAVSGTHGKTTTTAMLVDVFANSSLDPTVIVGSLLKDSHSNFVPGEDDMFVVEACEYKRSFLQLHPDVLVITNIDNDHLDYFDDLADIQSAFGRMVDNTADDGVVVCNPQDEKTQPALEPAPEVIDYTKISLDGELQVFGDHNRLNAQAAVATAKKVGVREDVAKEAVREFTGTWRRAQKKGRMENGALIYDDYGHHPTEIRSTLAGFTDQFPDRELVVVFQPHLYSRTKKLLDDFAESFDQADHIIVLPIYAAREAPDADTSAQDLVEELQRNHDNVSFAEDFRTAEAKIGNLVDDNSLILTQGAGDVYEIADALISGQK